jgi:hypothetical protein
MSELVIAERRKLNVPYKATTFTSLPISLLLQYVIRLATLY